MKNEADKRRPMASVMTESVGYKESGIGLEIAFGAFHTQQKMQDQRKMKFKSKFN